MDGIIETATGDLLRAGYSTFSAGPGETLRTDVPEGPLVRYAPGESQMHRWTGAIWTLVANPAEPGGPIGDTASKIRETGGPTLLTVGAIADGQYFKRSGTTVVGDTPAGGSGNFGTALLDFGAFPGASDASVAVTGQAGIGASSKVNAWLFPADTADHTADEHILETLKVFAGNIVPGTGFTIYGVNSSQLNEALEPGGGVRTTGLAIVGAAAEDGAPRIGGRGTLIYGKWNVAWQWA